MWWTWSAASTEVWGEATIDSDTAWPFGKYYGRERGAELRLVLAAEGIPPYAVIVDVGSGDGAVALEILRPGDRLVAVDLDRERLLAGTFEARARLHHAWFIQANATRLPVASASCDIAILDGIIELAPDMSAVVREVRRVLRPAGVVYLVVPNPYSPFTILDDPHAHLPLTHLLPRRVANWYAHRLMDRRVKELGSHFALPTWSKIQHVFAAAGIQLLLKSNLLKVERPDLVLSPRRRHFAELLRRLGGLRVARTPAGRFIVGVYDRWVARSWAFIGTNTSTDPTREDGPSP